MAKIKKMTQTQRVNFIRKNLSGEIDMISEAASKAWNKIYSLYDSEQLSLDMYIEMQKDVSKKMFNIISGEFSE